MGHTIPLGPCLNPGWPAFRHIRKLIGSSRRSRWLAAAIAPVHRNLLPQLQPSSSSRVRGRMRVSQGGRLSLCLVSCTCLHQTGPSPLTCSCGHWSSSNSSRWHQMVLCQVLWVLAVSYSSLGCVCGTTWTQVMGCQRCVKTEKYVTPVSALCHVSALSFAA